MTYSYQRDETFFVVGGTVRPDAPSYVKRPADEELYQLARSGHFCYVLATRQMGKSSLMIRADRRLQAQGVRTVKIDLTLIGIQEVTADQWYLGLLTLLKRRLNLSIDPEDWWEKWSALSLIHRFTTFLRDVALAEIDSEIVIFIDEIDSTLKLDFTDDFFAAIRATYNARADDPDFNRLTFVLLGVATPADLIQDTVRTPFNIGYGIDLHEFDLKHAQIFEKGLIQAGLDQSQFVLARVFYWTNGHPYLTQKICKAITDSPDKTWTDADVDRLIYQLFLSEEGRQEENLQFIQAYIDRNPNRTELLNLYRKIYKGQRILEDKRSLEQNYLKLSGLVRPEKNEFQIRNEIYRQAFNLDWVKANLPVDISLRIAIISTVVALFLISVLVVSTWRQGQNTNETLADNYTTAVNSSADPTLKLDNLAKLFDLPDQAFKDRATSLFEAMPLEEKLVLFQNDVTRLQSQVRTVVRSTYVSLDNTTAHNRLLREMANALEQSKELESVISANEIARWLDGREAFANSNYPEARTAYSSAIDLNDSNPATLFERALVVAELEDYANALGDFDAVLQQKPEWESRVIAAIVNNPNLYNAWRRITGRNTESQYIALNQVVPTQTLRAFTAFTATSTATPSPTATATATPSETATTTATASNTATATATSSPTTTTTATATASATATNTSPPTASATFTASATKRSQPTKTHTPTAIPLPDSTIAGRVPVASISTATLTATHSPTATATQAATATPTQTATASAITTATSTSTSTSTSTLTPTPTVTPTPTQSATATPTATALPTNTPVIISRIIYAQGRGDTHDLALIWANAQPITVKLPKQAAAPTWAPDGRQIAFFGEPSIDSIDQAYIGGEGIWIVDNLGRNPTQLVKTDHIKNMSWSRDGQRLAFEINPPGQIAEIIIIDITTGRPLSRFSGQQPGWAPNSRRLAIKACLPACGLWQINPDGSQGRQLSQGGTHSYPAWSPNGRFIAFSAESNGNWDLFLLNVFTGAIERITSEIGVDTTPVFSRNGQEIIYRSSTTDMAWQIVRMRLSDRRRFLVKADVGPSYDWGLARPAVY